LRLDIAAIQAPPTGINASPTSMALATVATTTVAAALTSIADVTSTALPSPARSRGMTSAPATAAHPDRAEQQPVAGRAKVQVSRRHQRKPGPDRARRGDEQQRPVQ
jgi:hypothetical protein